MLLDLTANDMKMCQLCVRQWAGLSDLRAAGKIAACELCRPLWKRMRRRGRTSSFSGQGPVMGCSDHYFQDLSGRLATAEDIGDEITTRRPWVSLSMNAVSFLLQGRRSATYFGVCVQCRITFRRDSTARLQIFFFIATFWSLYWFSVWIAACPIPDRFSGRWNE
jgi:hypothetical protein